MATIRVATRGSAQATTQARAVGSRLEAAGHTVELVVVDTRGDRTQADNVPLHSIGGQGVFVKEVELRCPGDGRYDAAFFGGADRVLVVRGFADAFAAQWGRGSRVSEGEDGEATVMEVICYRVTD